MVGPQAVCPDVEFVLILYAIEKTYDLNGTSQHYQHNKHQHSEHWQY